MGRHDGGRCSILRFLGAAWVMKALHGHPWQCFCCRGTMGNHREPWGSMGTTRSSGKKLNRKHVSASLATREFGQTKPRMALTGQRRAGDHYIASTVC